MKGKRSSEEQLMRIWPEAEPLDNVREARRQHHKQHLENLRRKDMLPRLRNNCATCLTRRSFRLGLRRFCLSRTWRI